MKRLLFIALALALIAGAILLITTTRSDSQTQPGVRPGARADGAARTRDRAPGERRRHPRQVAGFGDRAAGESGTADDGEAGDAGDAGSRVRRVAGEDPDVRMARYGGNPVRTYTREDGAIVQDYRLKPGETRTRHQRPPGKAVIQRDVVSALRKAVLPHVRTCFADIPADKLPTSGTVQIDLGVSIRDGAATAAVTGVRASDLDRAMADVALRCIAGKLTDVSIPAEGHPVADNRRLSLPFRIGA